MGNLRNVNCAIVLGAGGFIGNYLVEELLNQNITTYAVVRKGSKGKLRICEHKNLTIIEGDDCSELPVMQACKTAVCFNMAWDGVAGAKRADYRVQLKNVENGLHMIELLSEKGISCFIGASSISEVEAQILLSKDQTARGERFIYSIAKLAMDYMGKIVAERNSVDYINAQISNVYGEYGLNNLILHSTIIKLLNGEQTEFTDGTQWYDFVYVKDVAQALVSLAFNGKAGASYYIGSGSPRKLKEYIEYIGERIAPSRNLGIGKLKGSDFSLPLEAFSTKKIMNDTGYLPTQSFEEHIEQLIKWYQMIYEYDDEDRVSE